MANLEGNSVRVDFPSQSGWNSIPEHLEVLPDPSSGGAGGQCFQLTTAYLQIHIIYCVRFTL